MKTPDEIKKGLKCCLKAGCRECSYTHVERCGDVLHGDALAYIRQLESENADLKSRLAQAEREMDAVLHDLADSGNCHYCEHEKLFDTCGNKGCYMCADKTCPCREVEKRKCHFKWRGLCPENTKEEAK